MMITKLYDQLQTQGGKGILMGCWEAAGEFCKYSQEPKNPVLLSNLII